MAQTSFANAPGALFEGQRAAMRASDLTADGVLVADETIPLGKFIVHDTANGDRAVKLPSGASDKIAGVTYNAGTKELTTSGTLAFVQKDRVSHVRRGEVAVVCEETVAVTDPVYARHTAAGADLPGNARKSDGSTAGAVRKQTLTISGALDGGRGQIKTLAFDGVPSIDLGTKRKQTLTISGALDGGRARVQKLVLSADLAALDTVDGAIDGHAIASVAFDGVSHLSTMELIVTAIRDVLDANGLRYDHVNVGGATNREIHITGFEPSPTDLPLTLFAVTHGGGGAAAFASATGADLVAGKAPHGLSVELDGGAALVQDCAGTSNATLRAFAELLEAQAAIESAVVTQVTGGAKDNGERVITVTSAVANPAANAFTNPTATGGATGRTMAVAETQAGVAAAGTDSLAVTIDGTPIAAQAFVAGQTELAYLQRVADAIIKAADTAAAGPDGGSTIQSATVDLAAHAVRIKSFAGFPTAHADLVFTNGSGSGVAATMTATVANAAPHSLSVELDGAPAVVQEWRGSSDATLRAFADLLAGQPDVASAVVTPATDTGGGVDDAERVITLTSTSKSATALALTNPTVSGGLTPRTMAAAQTQAGSAAAAAIATLVPNARWKTSGSAGAVLALEINLP